MSTTFNRPGHLLSNIPEEVRGRIVSGMRWTLWLSLLTAPLGYATTVLLARSGPEVIGAYGIVLSYGALSSCLFYFGGDAVVIKFLPELDAKNRLSFLASYYGIACLALIPWLLLALAWPGQLHYVFGQVTSPRTQAALVCLAPVYILFSLTQAGLKSILHIREAQVLMRVVTVGSFVTYGLLFVFLRRFILAYYSYLVWGVYLSLIAAVGLAGIVLLVKACPDQKWGFHLPSGFWKYTVATEQVSALGFVAGALNFYLVLNYGGLGVLGKFVVVSSLADMLRLPNRYITDSLMPSLTNLIARGNRTGVAELFSVHFRTLLLINCAACTAAIAFVGPISAVVGPGYRSIQDLFILAAFLCGTGTTAMLGGILLSSFGKQHYQIATNFLQLVCSAGLFILLWPTWHLKGAVISSWGGLLVASLALLWVARTVTQVKVAFVKDYTVLLAITSTVAWVTLHYLPLRFATALALWVMAVLTFAALAGYSIAEIKAIVHHFVPGRAMRLLGQVRTAARTSGV